MESKIETVNKAIKIANRLKKLDEVIRQANGKFPRLCKIVNYEREDLIDDLRSIDETWIDESWL